MQRSLEERLNRRMQRPYKEAIACASNLISENKGINPMWVWCSVWRIQPSEKSCASIGDRVWQHGVGSLES